MNTRILGWTLALGSLIVAMNSFRPDDLDRIGSLAILLWSIGGVCGLVGMMRLNALGFNPVARAFGFLPVLGFITLFLGDSLRLMGFSQLGDPLNNTLASIGWIGILSGMLVVGIITIAAKVWRGWRRFLPLSIIVIIPISFASYSLIGTDFGGFLAFLPWVLLGYVIATMQPAVAKEMAVAA